MPSAAEDPFERSARLPGRATFTIHRLDLEAAAPRDALRRWDWVARSILSRTPSPSTRLRLEDSRRIVGELAAVLDGGEPGAGPPEERLLWGAYAGGELQGLASLFPCRRAVFVELLAAAPWNLLGPADPADARTVRGAGTALLGAAGALARASGAGGRVTLQAENPRSLAVYRRLGFAPMRPSDAPLSLVPCGPEGWPAGAVRIARGAAGREEREAPWLVLDPTSRRATPTGRPERARPAPEPAGASRREASRAPSGAADRGRVSAAGC